MSRLIYGIAYNSKGKHKSRQGKGTSPTYRAWRNMIERCYSPKSRQMAPTYLHCSVTKEWLNFQEFAEWYENDAFFGNGYQLDKDLLVPSNKLYHPDLCCLVPSQLNSILLARGNDRGKYPQGVCFYKPYGKYLAQLNAGGKKIHLGYFDTPKEAYQTYKIAKENYVKEVANEWRGRIDERVYEALMIWTLIN